MNTNLGGNLVASHDLQTPQIHTFATTPYSYTHLRLQDRDTLTLPTGNGHYSAFILSLDSGASLTCKGVHTPLLQGDAVQIHHADLELHLEGGASSILLAGTQCAPKNSPSVLHCPANTIKKVSKPWGHELWIHGTHAEYALKQIFVKAGTKTSLQYHRYKQETNVLFSGEALLHYKSAPEASIDAPGTAIRSVLLKPISSVDVTPFVLHRLEAKTDILLYEVSTPHLDDVVRVSDDSQRPDGRIETEHSS